MNFLKALQWNMHIHKPDRRTLLPDRVVQQPILPETTDCSITDLHQIIKIRYEKVFHQ